MVKTIRSKDKVDGKEHYRAEILKRFAALENLDDDVGINIAWETIRENIKISAKVSLRYYELTKHKPWFDEGWSKLLDQRNRQIATITISKPNKWR
jgi:hypothetical protein